MLNVSRKGGGGVHNCKFLIISCRVHPQTISVEVWWYYMFHLSVYISHTYSQLVHSRRNDFLEMFIHHVVTILLMALSWTSNSVRIGTLVLVVHDCADIFMEAARYKIIQNFKNLKSSMRTSLYGRSIELRNS